MEHLSPEQLEALSERELLINLHSDMAVVKERTEGLPMGK